MPQAPEYNPITGKMDLRDPHPLCRNVNYGGCDLFDPLPEGAPGPGSQVKVTE